MSWGTQTASPGLICIRHSPSTLHWDRLLCEDSYRASRLPRCLKNWMIDHSGHISRTGSRHPRPCREILCLGHRLCSDTLLLNSHWWGRTKLSLPRCTRDEEWCARTTHCPWTPSTEKSIAHIADRLPFSWPIAFRKKKRFWNFFHLDSSGFLVKYPSSQSTLKFVVQPPIIYETSW